MTGIIPEGTPWNKTPAPGEKIGHILQQRDTPFGVMPLKIDPFDPIRRKL